MVFFLHCLIKNGSIPMKHLLILYIGMREGLDICSMKISLHLQQVLSACGELHLLGDLFLKQSFREGGMYDLVIVQNSFCFIRYKDLFKRLSNSLVLFVSTGSHVIDYVAPFKNLYGVINMGDATLSTCGIPEEMQLRLCCPVESMGNYYFYEQQPEVCRIVYSPTGNSVGENDFKMLTFLKQTNASLTIVSDEYACLKSAFPSFVKVMPRSSRLSAYKQAHLVVASGADAVQALALCKPCVVLGDYGLGGLVTSENYAQLQSVHFKGRKGGCFGESVSSILLESVIRRVFAFDRMEDVLFLQKQVLTVYGKPVFKKRVLQEIKRITDLSTYMNNRRKRLLLKPRLSSLFTLEDVDGKSYLKRGLTCFGELDGEMIDLLNQCDGTVSVLELSERSGYDREDLEILWSNLYELCKEKLILFGL